MLFSKTNRYYFALSAGIILTSLLCSLCLNRNYVSAYTASITTNDSISLDVSPSGDGTSIHSESINVQSDCRAGYNLTIATPEGSSLYKYENNTQAGTASFTAVDGTSALNSSDNTNKWGYTLTANPTSSTVFLPLSSTQAVLKTPSQTASPSTDIDDTFDINYGVKVDNTIAPGNYQMASQGAVVYYLTMDTTCTQYTVAFDANGGAGTMDSQNMEQGVSTSLSENSFTAPAFGSSYEDSDGNTITGVATTYWKFSGWNTAADGTGTNYADKESVTDMVGVGSTITLYAQWEALSGLRVDFDSNGMEFEDETTSNTMGYYYGGKTVYVSAPSYSHTSNINDDGTQKGSTTYSAYLATKDVVSKPGAVSLHVTISYGTENNWDMLYVFKGEYTGSVTRNMSAGQLAKYMGGNNTLTTVELDIPGDTATFAFYSDNSNQYYGYYATVVGYYETEPESYDSTTVINSRSLVFGEYREPVVDDNHVFLGWSENSAATTPDYTSSEDILNNLPGNNGDTKTLYAIWNPRYHIVYVNNCKSFVGDSSCTQEMSDTDSRQIVDLDSSGDGSATLQEFDATWALSGWKIKGWNTSADGTGTFYERRSTYNISGASAGDSITLYAQWALPYLIQYDGNGADNPNGMGTTDESTGLKSVKQTNIGEGDLVTLLASNFKRTGYGFVGWSIDASATSTNGVKIYGPNETILAPERPINGDDFITMHAIWQKAEEDNGGNPIYLQDFDRTQCSNLTQASFNSTTGVITAGSVIALTDKRDNEVYTVARLADGNCWMVDNLRIGAEGTRGQNQNDNTVTNQYLSQGYGGYSGNDTNYGNFIGLAASETSNFSSSAVANSVYYSGTQSGTATIDIGTSNYAGFRLPRYNGSNTDVNTIIDSTTFTQDYTDANNVSSSGTYNEANLYSFGNYYSWNAAMANTNNYTSSTYSEVTGTSICPSGWSIPSSYGTGKEYGLLSVAYGGSNVSVATNEQEIVAVSNRLRSYPNNFIYAGIYSGSSASLRSREGMYWSRSVVSGMYVDDLDISALYYRLGGGYSRFAGLSVRCMINSSKVEVVLDNNNGTGNVNRVYGTPGSSVRLPSYIAAEYGQEFQKWNTAQDGSGNNYTSSYSIPSGSTGVTLYAQWSSQFIVKYVNNCRNYVVNNYCTQSDSDRTDETGITLDASGNGSGNLQSSEVWSVLGWKIVEWNTSADETGTQYAVNDAYSVTNQSAGDSVTLYGVWRKTYKISYNINGGDEGTMGDQALAEDYTAIAESSRVMLLASNYSRSGYGFVGWSTDPNAATNPNAKIYGPHETIIAPAYPENGVLKLYAVWVQSAGSLQDSAKVAELCGTNGTGGSLVTAPTDGSANISSVSALTDQRDNETYAIARLADGNCWMIENLRLEADSTRGATNEALSQGYGKSLTYGNFIGLADAEFTNVSDLASIGEPNSLYSDDGANGTVNIGNTDYQSSRMPRYNNLNTPSNPADRPQSPTLNTFARNNTTVGMYSYGNYYTWAAALASTIHYSGLNATDANGETSMTANTSICPKGWRLPYSGRGVGGMISGSFSYLDVRLGGTGDISDDSTNPTGTAMSDKWRAYPNNMLLAGYFNTASANYRGSLGLYWTSGSAGNSNADDNYFTIDYVSPSSGGGKGYGNSVRCVVDNS